MAATKPRSTRLRRRVKSQSGFDEFVARSKVSPSLSLGHVLSVDLVKFGMKGAGR